MKKSTISLLAAYLLYALLALAPAAVAIALDWSVYTQSTARCVSLSFAGVLAVTLICLQAVGHTPKKVKRVVWYALAAGVLWLLRPIVSSLALLTTCMAAGELAAMLVAAPLIRHIKDSRRDGRLAEAVADAVQEAQGRV